MQLVLCDDNRILCEALASILQKRGHPILATTTSVAEGIAAVAAHRPDACLLDLHFPDGNGLDAARAMRCRHPDTKIVVLSCLTDPAVMAEAKKIGVAGFLRKDQKADTISGVLDLIAAGGVAFDPRLSQPGNRPAVVGPCADALRTLTSRESQVLHRIVDGQSTKQMAKEMNVTMSTVRSYIKSVLAKLGAHSRLQAAAMATGMPDRLIAGRPASGSTSGQTEVKVPGWGDDRGSGLWESVSSLSTRNVPLLMHLPPGSGPRTTWR